jgi:cell division protein FtsX
MSKKKKIGEVEIFYIQGNCNNKTQEEIAEIIGVNSKDIEEIYLKSKRKSNDKFQKYSGTTSMTEAQSSITTVRSNKNSFDEKNIHRL